MISATSFYVIIHFFFICTINFIISKHGRFSLFSITFITFLRNLFLYIFLNIFSACLFVYSLYIFILFFRLDRHTNLFFYIFFTRFAFNRLSYSLFFCCVGWVCWWISFLLRTWTRTFLRFTKNKKIFNNDFLTSLINLKFFHPINSLISSAAVKKHVCPSRRGSTEWRESRAFFESSHDRNIVDSLILSVERSVWNSKSLQIHEWKVP